MARGRVPRFLAKASLFKVPVLGAALRATGQIPVERAAGQRSSDPISTASRFVDDGFALIIYPEGTLTRDPDEWPMRGKFGAVRLALEHDIEIIPVGIWGAQTILPRYSKRLSLFPRKDVRVLIGEPISLAAWRDAPRSTATYAAATDTRSCRPSPCSCRSCGMKRRPRSGGTRPSTTRRSSAASTERHGTEPQGRMDR